MNRKWTSATVTILLLLVGVGWAASLLGEDPRITELNQMREDSLQNEERMTGEQRDQFREKLHELPEEQRRQFFENSRGQFQQFAMRRMNEFFEKSPEEQRAALDQMIDRMEERRTQREQRGGEAREDGRNRPSSSPQQRDQRRKQGLDRGTPEMRSMRDTFRNLLNNRRQERGLEPIHGRPGRGHF
jgi:hypothetical protein